MRTIVLTGGGTGGHIYPSLALVPKLKKHFERIHFIGGAGIEREIVANVGLPFSEVPAVKFRRSLSLSNFLIPCRLLASVKKSTLLLEQIKPNIVFSKGGYASLPTVIAARKMHIPVVCHESDSTLGLANKIGKFCGATIATAMPILALKNKSYVYTGMPLREELFEQSTVVAKSKIADTNKPILLIVGGSSGAMFLNSVVYAALPELTKQYFVVHISGKRGDFSVSSENYQQLEFTNQIETYYAASDYVLSRAGATAVAELSALNKKAIIVPLPKGVSRGDQLDNAQLARELGAKVVFQHDFSAGVLIDALESLVLSPPMRSISKNANSAVIELLVEKAL